jgi:hypothetical protein
MRWPWLGQGDNPGSAKVEAALGRPGKVAALIHGSDAGRDGVRNTMPACGSGPMLKTS